MRALPRLLNRQAVSLPVLSLLLHGPVGVLTVVGAAVDAEDVVGILERVSEHRLHCARPSVYHRTCWCRNSVWPAIRPIPGGCSRFWHPTGSRTQPGRTTRTPFALRVGCATRASASTTRCAHALSARLGAAPLSRRFVDKATPRPRFARARSGRSLRRARCRRESDHPDPASAR